MVNSVQQQPPPKISILPNLWVIIPIIAVVVAILSANLLLLNYIHVFTVILWTGTDIFMAFLLGPVLRNVSLATRKEVIFWLIAKNGILYANCSCCYNYCWLFSCFENGFDYFRSPNYLLDFCSPCDSFYHVYTGTWDSASN
jgi:hypothetical protein